MKGTGKEWNDVTKSERYAEVTGRIEALLKDENDSITMMATIACELKQSFDMFSWVGFYRMVGSGVLKVGPYQGTHGCIEIPPGKGVCGKCVLEKTTQVVDDVSAIPYHIACSRETKSEIVVPVFHRTGVVLAVLDIDSNFVRTFDDVDKKSLERICSIFHAVS